MVEDKVNIRLTFLEGIITLPIEIPGLRRQGKGVNFFGVPVVWLRLGLKK